MALDIFKGIEQTTYAAFTGKTAEVGKLYLVQNKDGEYGDIYFGSRHYGHFNQTEINNLAQAINDIAANKVAISGNTESIKQQKEKFDALVSLVDSMVKYEYKKIDSADVPEGVTPDSKDEKPEPVGKTDPEYIKVGDQYYHKEAVSTSEVLESLKTIINEVDTKFDNYKIKSVAKGDKVLSVDGQGALSSTMSLKYDSDQKKIILYGGAEDDAHKIGEVDTTDFIKDGMLETAELVTVTEEDGKYVYGEGESKTDVSESVNKPGKYIRLAFNTSEGEHKKDIFLSVQDLVDVYTGGKDIVVNKDNSIDVALDEDITVMGVNVGTLKNDTKLTKGMSLSEILKQMLIREIDVVAATPSVEISMLSPSAGNTTYEVGTSVNVVLRHTYTDGRFKGADSLYNYDVAAGCTEGETTYKRGDTTVADGTETVTVEEGTYTYNCTTAYAASTVKPVKNNGKESGTVISAGSCKSGNVLFYGRFYGYIGYSEKTSAAEFDSDSIKALGAVKTFLKVNETTTLVGTTAKTSNGTSIVIAVPNKYKLATINNGVGADILANFTSDGTVNYTVGTTNTTYHVYVYPITNNAEVEYKNVTITKA